MRACKDPVGVRGNGELARLGLAGG